MVAKTERPALSNERKEMTIGSQRLIPAGSRLQRVPLHKVGNLQGGGVQLTYAVPDNGIGFLGSKNKG